MGQVVIFFLLAVNLAFRQKIIPGLEEIYRKFLVTVQRQFNCETTRYYSGQIFMHFCCILITKAIFRKHFKLLVSQKI